MSETRAYDGPNWRDNPDEYKPPVRRGGGFLASRGDENPEIATVKFGLAEDIQRAVARLGAPSQDGVGQVQRQRPCSRHDARPAETSAEAVP